MSRIGKEPISVPSDVQISIQGRNVGVKGPKGSLDLDLPGEIDVREEDGAVLVERPSDDRKNKALHGLTRSLINNMVIGVSQGFKKELEVIGVGYRANARGQQLDLSLGYSHNIILEFPKEIKVTTVSEKGKAPIVTLESIDKQLVGQAAAKIRSLRKPEPYKGKGIKYLGEELRRKAGKTAAK